MKRNAIFSDEGIESTRVNSLEWDFHNEKTQMHLHALHPYPARFIPQIPKKALVDWSKPGNSVLDPFCGCGTTLLEGILSGRYSIGVDNNAVAVLISRAKTAKYTPENVKELSNFSEKLDGEKIQSTIIEEYPQYKSLSYWFDEKAINELAFLRQTIGELSELSKLFAMAVFSSVIVRVSYQDSDTRYSRKERPYIQNSAIVWFEKKLKDSLRRVEEIIDVPKADCEIHLKDSRNLHFISEQDIDLIITSPPYLNAYDYHKYHRHRLHWIEGDVEFARDQEIGKHDYFTRPGTKSNQYFIDMKQCFLEWQRVLKPGARAIVVIGDAIVHGEPVPVGDKFVAICNSLGLTCENRWIRKLQTDKKSFNQKARINKEHVLLFRKS